jgi:nifR3 family TIM-barrel protein
MIHETKIGTISLKNNIFTAPLAGISDKVFCQQMLKYGAGLVYSEMIATAGLSRASKKTVALAALGDTHPVALQLFGNKPDEFANAAKYVDEHNHADIIDINMGCPVKKVTHPGSGAALMRDLPLAKEIIIATVKNTKKPVTVKFRLGWDSTKINFLELGKICEGEGVSAICLHPRTRAQSFSGTADWSKIAELKQAVKIPVIGNGDIKSRAEVQRMQVETGCDAVMIGRAAMGNPWLIRSIIEDRDVVPTLQESIEEYLWHVREMINLRGPEREKFALCEMRKFAHRYLHGFPGVAHLRQEINRIESLAELQLLLASHAE